MQKSPMTSASLETKLPDIQRVGLGTYKSKGDDCVKMVEAAIKAGYRAFDTAVLYGNHEHIRQGIARAGIDRQELYLSSKIHDRDQLADRVQQSVDQILKELGLEYIDQLLLHAPVGGEAVMVRSWRALEEAQKAGKVRHIGVSNFKITDLEILLKHAHVTPFVNQFEITPFNTRSCLVKYCLDKGIKIQAWGSLTVGRRLDDQRLLAIATEVGLTPAEVLLKWALQMDFYIIPKPLTTEHLQENYKIQFKTPLSEAVLNQLDKLNDDYYTIRRYMDPKPTSVLA